MLKKKTEMYLRRRQRREDSRKNNDVCIRSEEESFMRTMDVQFTILELEWALAKAGMSRQEKDKICYVMLKQLGKQIKSK